MDAKAFGQKGEAAAARYYLDRGCRLLAHNYRTRMGELDLVLMEGETVVIAEVKARSETRRGPAAEAVGPAKQRRIILAAQRFYSSPACRSIPCASTWWRSRPPRAACWYIASEAPLNFEKAQER